MGCFVHNLTCYRYLASRVRLKFSNTTTMSHPRLWRWRKHLRRSSVATYLMSRAANSGGATAKVQVLPVKLTTTRS